MNLFNIRSWVTSFCLIAVAIGTWAAAPSLETVKGVPFEGGKSVAAPAYAADANQKETLDYTLALDPYTATALSDNYVNQYVYQAFCLTDYNASLYAGAQITAINLYTGVNVKTGNNDVKDITVFIMDATGTKVLYSQDAKITGNRYTFTSVKLDTPYTIEADKGLVVGYKLKVPNKDMYYMVVDGVAREESEGCYVGIENDAWQVSWTNLSTSVGNLNIGMTVVGDNLPKNGATLLAAQLQPVCYPGQPFDSQIIIFNNAINNINSVEVKCQVGDSEPFTQEVKLSKPVKYGTYDFAMVPNLISEKEGLGIPVSLEIVKVNGEENITKENIGIDMEATCFTKENGFDRTFVVEEGTGTWCGWCPAGIVMMETLKEKYPENIVRIALHYEDQMSETSCDPVLGLYTAYPSVLLNRTKDLSPTAPSCLQDIDDFITTFGAYPAVAGVTEIKVLKNERDEVEVGTNVRFALNTPTNGSFGLAYYITEDGVGPYLQTNFYAGGENGQMGDWANRLSSVNVKFDDVARYFTGSLEGCDSFIPTYVEVDKDYTDKVTLPLTSLSSDNFYITALIVDRNTGAIVNCKQIPVTRGSDNGDNNQQENGATLISAQVQPVCYPGQPFETQLIVINETINNISSLEVKCKVGESEEFTKEIKLEKPLEYGACSSVLISDLISEEEGLGVLVHLDITKVNGKDNIAKNREITTKITCFAKENGFKRTYLIEEGTGTWCGLCPAGIVMMEKLSEIYPDEVVRVSLHSDDQMETASCYPVLELYSGFPSAFLNRSENLVPSVTTCLQSIDDYINAYRAYPTVAEVSDIIVVKNERNEIVVNADISFALNTPTNESFGMSYYITEDQVGPYRQTNYYAGGERGEMGNWANLNSTVNILFDNVARSFTGGLEGRNKFIPENVEVGKRYSDQVLLPLNSLSGEKFYVTALIVDRNTGTIVNCKQIPVIRDSGINSTVAILKTDYFHVVAGKGELFISGDFTSAQIFDFCGSMVAILDSEATVSLPAGIYMVVIDGKAFKTVVK